MVVGVSKEEFNRTHKHTITEWVKETLRFHNCHDCAKYSSKLGCKAGLFSFEKSRPGMYRKVGDLTSSGVIKWSYNDYYGVSWRVPCYWSYSCENPELQISSPRWEGTKPRFTITDSLQYGVIYALDIVDYEHPHFSSLQEAKDWCERRLNESNGKL
jgi:hypothetical protein